MFYGHQQHSVSYHSQLPDSNLSSSHPYSSSAHPIVASGDAARLPHGATLGPPGFEAQPRRNQDPHAGSIAQASLAFTSVTSSIPPSAVDVAIPNYEQSKVDEPIWCNICKIKCYRKEIFDIHVCGKKHKKNLKRFKIPIRANNISSHEQIASSGVAGSHVLEVKPPNVIGSGTTSEYVKTCTICNVACSSHEVLIAHVTGKKHAIQGALIALNGNNSLDAQVHQNKTKLVPSLWCEICKVLCNSVEDFNIHILGKKHRRLLDKIRKYKWDIDIDHSISLPVASTTNALIGSVESSEAYKSPRRKKQKVTEGGEGGVSADGITVCTLCNTSCHSFTDFTMHLIDQKHLAMMEIYGLI